MSYNALKAGITKFLSRRLYSVGHLTLEKAGFMGLLYHTGMLAIDIVVPGCFKFMEWAQNSAIACGQ